MQDPQTKTVPVTVEDYHHMIETGELTENDRVELLEGVIVEMAPIGSRHRATVTLLNQLLSALITKGWHVACQQPVSLSESEPEPDLSIVRGEIVEYLDRLPSASDVSLVIEVADTSLDLDRKEKAAIYAKAKIPEYWIVDLEAKQVEILREPTKAGYLSKQTIGAAKILSVTLDDHQFGDIRVADFLP